MASPDSISTEDLASRVGTPSCPALIDVQTDEDFAADPRLIPGAVRRPWDKTAEWLPEFAGRPAVVIRQKGKKLSQGVPAQLARSCHKRTAVKQTCHFWLARSATPAPALPQPGTHSWGCRNVRAALGSLVQSI